MAPIGEARYDFSGSVVMVTGAGRGLGRSHALRFAEAGATVVLCDLDPDGSEVTAAIEQAGGRCLYVACDVSDHDSVAAATARAVDELGRIDVLINNAGVESTPLVVEMTESDWDRVLDIHLKGTFLCSKFAAQQMVRQGSGRIISTGSTSSLLGLPRQAHYCAAKHGIIGFSKAMAIELAPYGTTVNVVCPGSIATPMRNDLAAGGPEAEWIASLPELVGSKNLFAPGTSLDPGDVTGAMLWLASDAASAVTGATVVVDAGYSIK